MARFPLVSRDWSTKQRGLLSQTTAANGTYSVLKGIFYLGLNKVPATPRLVSFRGLVPTSIPNFSFESPPPPFRVHHSLGLVYSLGRKIFGTFLSLRDTAPLWPRVKRSWLVFRDRIFHFALLYPRESKTLLLFSKRGWLNQLPLSLVTRFRVSVALHVRQLQKKALICAEERRHELDQRGTDGLQMVKILRLWGEGGICGKRLGALSRRITGRLAPI